MKIAVINFSGNVGKSTIANYLLLPRIPKARLIPIETANARPSQTDALDPRQYDDILAAVLGAENVVVDVGASSAATFFRQMRRYPGTAEDFDLFLVPTTLDEKSVRDTVATMAELVDTGARHEGIICVPNRIVNDFEVADALIPVRRFQADHQGLRFDPGRFLHENEIYSRARLARIDIDAIAQDKTDLRAAISKSKSGEELAKLVQRLATRRLATGVQAELDSIFAWLLAQPDLPVRTAPPPSVTVR